MRITEAVDRFRIDNRKKGLAEETIAYYDTMLDIFLRKTGAVQLGELTQEFVDGYKCALIQTQKSKASVNAHLRALRRFLYFCKEEQLHSDVTVTMIKEEVLPKPTYSAEDVERVIRSASFDNEDSVIALLLIASGIRSATLCNMRVADVSLDENTIILRHTKNKHPYILPLPQTVIGLLKQYIVHFRRSEKELLFPNADGNKMTHNVLWRHVTKYLRRTGINKTGVHKFRHTFAKTVCKNGLNSSIMLMRLLGQSTIQQAERYVNLYGNELSDVMTKYNPVSH